MLRYDWENSVGYWICAASHAMRKSLESRLLKEDITLRQWEVLAWLSARGSGSQSEIADQLGVEPHTLGGVVKRMVKAGLLECRTSETDRRKNTIHPTPRAEDVWDRVAVIFHANREQAIQGLTESDLENLKRMLRKIYDNVRQTHGSVPEFDPRLTDTQFIDDSDADEPSG